MCGWSVLNDKLIYLDSDVGKNLEVWEGMRGLRRDGFSGV